MDEEHRLMGSSPPFVVGRARTSAPTRSILVLFLPSSPLEVCPMNRLQAIRLSGAVAILCPCILASAADQYSVTYERHLAVKMRDGATLPAVALRPKAAG